MALTAPELASAHQRIEMLERLLERSISIPGMRHRIGLDAIAGLVPVAGDLLGAGLGLWIVYEAHRLGVPKWKLWRMLGNIGLDTAVGAVPLVGDLFDLMFRSNSANLKIVRRHMDRHHPHLRAIDV